MIKRGAESCLGAVGDAPLLDVPAIRLAKEKIINNTTAGDSFSAGYLARRLTGASAEAAAQRSHLTASTVIQHRGAIIPVEAMPKRPREKVITAAKRTCPTHYFFLTAPEKYPVNSG